MTDVLGAASGTTHFATIPLRPRFFQASSFFPMPIVLLCTRGAKGEANLAPYSLCFPRLDEDARRMELIARTSSKTAQNLQRGGRVSINFIPDKPDYIAQCKKLAEPVSTGEKMSGCTFTLIPSELRSEISSESAPPLVGEAVQAMECRLVEARPTSDGKDTHFVLEVEAIRMQAYWARLLESGRSGPRLPVDYGFRKNIASWSSRPTLVSLGPGMRPTFVVEVPHSPEEVMADFSAALEQPGLPISGKIRRNVMQLGIPKAEQTTWSPSMDLSVEASPTGSTVRARIGPLPEIWLAFIYLHLMIAIAGMCGLMWGVSQWMLGGPLWALWVPVAALFLHAFVAGASLVGQGLSADQIYRLRGFVSDVLGP